MENKKKVFVEDIRKVHKYLRKKYHEQSDFDRVWKEHCQNIEILKGYATAMQDLAIEVWDEQCDGKHRIKWCYETCMKYFHDGGLEKLREKDKRRKIHYQKDQSSFFCGPNPRQSCDVETSNDKFNDVNKSEKLKLLDVGSCYDPFRGFSEYETTAIDISPAKENVLKCDFINVNISTVEEDCVHNHSEVSNLAKSKCLKPREPSSSTCQKIPFIRSEEDSITIVNERESKHPQDQFIPKEISHLPTTFYHVVVFSLLLTYIPSPNVRWEMCKKAYEVLRTNGLLLIITPDSNHQNKNAHLMKKWKHSVELIGFQRISYEKDIHLHFMAFRKVPNDFLWDVRNEHHLLQEGNLENMCLHIPQDFQEYESSSSENESTPNEDCEDTMQNFLELPRL